MGEVCQVKRIVDLYWLDYLWTLLFFALAAFVVGRLLTSFRRIRQFPVFFAYALWQLASTTAYWVLFLYWGNSTQLYSVYQVFQIVALVSITAVLVDIYFKLKPKGDWSHWLGLLAFLVGVGALVQDPKFDYYYALVTVFMLFNCALAVMVQWMRVRSRVVDLGDSYTRILFGLSLMLAFQTSLYSYSLLGVTPDSWQVSLAQPVAIVGWIWFVVAVCRIDLPHPLEEAAEGQFEEELELVASPRKAVVE